MNEKKKTRLSDSEDQCSGIQDNKPVRQNRGKEQC